MSLKIAVKKCFLFLHILKSFKKKKKKVILDPMNLHLVFLGFIIVFAATASCSAQQVCYKVETKEIELPVDLTVSVQKLFDIHGKGSSWARQDTVSETFEFSETR